MFPALARKIVGQALALPRAFCHLKPPPEAKQLCSQLTMP